MLDSLAEQARDAWDRLRWGWDDTSANQERRRAALVGLPGAGKKTLFKSLFGWSAATEPLMDEDVVTGSTVHDYGLFTLMDLPLEGYQVEEARLYLESADVIIYLLDAAAGLRDEDCQWIARLRVGRAPLMLVLNKADLLDDRLPAARAEIENCLAMSVIPLCARDSGAVQSVFVSALVRDCPSLAAPLALQVKSVRREAALRLIRQSTAFSLVTSVEPLPLLDIPVLIGLQIHLLNRIGALYGHNQASIGQGAIILAVAVGLVMRYIAQTALKFLPYAGWVLSGAVAATGTWIVGRAALTYYETGGLPKKRGEHGLHRPS